MARIGSVFNFLKRLSGKTNLKTCSKGLFMISWRSVQELKMSSPLTQSQPSATVFSVAKGKGTLYQYLLNSGGPSIIAKKTNTTASGVSDTIPEPEEEVLHVQPLPKLPEDESDLE